MSDPMRGSASRFHSLDALRGFALLLGIVYHSVLAYRLPPGIWAVGTDDPPRSLMWFVYYAHTFRMEVFFLLAGFFAGVVIRRRGMSHFVRDRAKRILLVFVVALYPMKYLLGWEWIAGGLETGWIRDLLPPEVAAMPAWRIAILGLQEESLPDIRTTHLWFLYYLVIITGAFVAARWLLLKAASRAPGLLAQGDRAFRGIMKSPLASLWIALPVMPMLALMKGLDVDTPDTTLV